jgi:hypothetical protein
MVRSLPGVKPSTDLGEGMVVVWAKAVIDRKTVKKKMDERRLIIMSVLCRDRWRTGLQDLQD